MYRPLIRTVFIILPLSFIGCQSSPPYISGVVRYPSGEPVAIAKVWTDTGFSTFSDDKGRYSIMAPDEGETVTVSASDGHAPGQRYVETHSGSVEVLVGEDGAMHDIVLDHSTPI